MTRAKPITGSPLQLSPSRGRFLALGVGLLLGLSATARAVDNVVISTSPPAYGLLTLRSGHTYKYLKNGPLIGKGGKQLGLALAYASDIVDQAKLEAAAEELFEYIRPVAELQKQEGVAVMAYLNYEPGQAISNTVMWNVVFTRGSDGKWSRLPSKPGTVPKIERRSPYAEIVRDEAAEKAALKSAESWLAILDQGNYTDSWATASPMLKGMTSKEKWETLGSVMRSELGKLVARTPVATHSTRSLPGVPPGSYVVFEYRSQFENKPWSFESITEVLCEDREWRVAGYFVRN